MTISQYCYKKGVQSYPIGTDKHVMYVFHNLPMRIIYTALCNLYFSFKFSESTTSGGHIFFLPTLPLRMRTLPSYRCDQRLPPDGDRSLSPI